MTRMQAKPVNFGIAYGCDEESLRRLHLDLAAFFYRQAIDYGGGMYAEALAEAYRPEGV